MAENLEDHAPRPPSRIFLGQPQNVNYWTEHLGVDKETLKRAVAAVGPDADAVRSHLLKPPRQPN
jgi:hypothetical protein